MDEAAGRLQGGDTATLRSTGSYQGVGVEGGRRKRLQSLEVIRFELGRCEVGGTNGPFRISRRTADGSRPVRLRTGQQRNEGGSQQYVQSWPFVVAISSAKGQSCRSPALHRHGHAVTEGGSAGSPSRLGVSVNWLVGGEVRGAAVEAAAGGEGDTPFHDLALGPQNIGIRLALGPRDIGVRRVQGDFGSRQLYVSTLGFGTVVGYISPPW